VFEKVAKVNQKGPFDALFCVGNFFAGSARSPAAVAACLEPYVKGERKVPIPTYFVAGADAGVAEEILGAHPNGGQSALRCAQPPSFALSRFV
jgi:hypothetical protein